MSKSGAAIIGVVIGFLAAIGVLIAGGGPVADQTPTTVTISAVDPNTHACSIDPMPVEGLKSGVGDYVIWQQKEGKPFTVTFPKGSIHFNTGSPFDSLLGNGWQTIFPSEKGDPYRTGQAHRNAWEISTFTYDFYIQTIVVDGVTCYDRQQKPIGNMKVHVN